MDLKRMKNPFIYLVSMPRRNNHTIVVWGSSGNNCDFANHHPPIKGRTACFRRNRPTAQLHSLIREFTCKVGTWAVIPRPTHHVLRGKKQSCREALRCYHIYPDSWSSRRVQIPFRNIHFIPDVCFPHMSKRECDSTWGSSSTLVTILVLDGYVCDTIPLCAPIVAGAGNICMSVERDTCAPLSFWGRDPGPCDIRPHLLYPLRGK